MKKKKEMGTHVMLLAGAQGNVLPNMETIVYNG
jgi:hypothetical protein